MGYPSLWSQVLSQVGVSHSPHWLCPKSCPRSRLGEGSGGRNRYLSHDWDTPPPLPATTGVTPSQTGQSHPSSLDRRASNGTLSAVHLLWSRMRSFFFQFLLNLSQSRILHWTYPKILAVLYSSSFFTLVWFSLFGVLIATGMRLPVANRRVPLNTS